MMYSTTESGSTPYRTKVMTAPSMVPWLDSASARLIMTTTYIQAIATRTMGVRDFEFKGMRASVMAR
jgi:hypothetical protein